MYPNQSLFWRVFLSSLCVHLLHSNPFWIKCEYNASVESYQSDPLELDQAWESAIRSVVIGNISLDNETEIALLRDQVLMKSNLSTGIDLPADTDEDDEPEESLPPISHSSSNTESVPVNTASTLLDYSDDDNDDQYWTQTMSRSDMITSLIRDFINNNMLKKLNFSDIQHLAPEERIRYSWIRLAEMMDQEIETMLKAITPPVMDIFYEIPLSGNCFSALFQLATGLQQRKSWAFKMIDSNGRLPYGIMEGVAANLGNFDQCLDVVAQTDNRNLYQGKYCFLQINFQLPEGDPSQRLFYGDSILNLTGSSLLDNPDFSQTIYSFIPTLTADLYSSPVSNAICIPSVCTEQDMEILFKKIFGEEILIHVDNCQTKSNSSVIGELLTANIKHELNSMNQFQLASILIVAVSIGVVLVSTVLDVTGLVQAKKTQMSSLMNCFSMRANWDRVFKVRSREPSDCDMTFVNGIRVISMLWVMMIHVFAYGGILVPPLYYRYEVEIRKSGLELPMQFLFNGYLSVESFFFVSGLLLVVIHLRARKKIQDKVTNKSNSQLIHVPDFGMYALLRYIRFFFPMLGLICFNFIWPLLGDGPYFHKVSNQIVANCENKWWRNILLINNYDNALDMCMIHTWFLSADFQLHLFAYPVIAILAANETLGLLFVGSLVVGGALIRTFLLLVNQYHPSMSLAMYLKHDQFMETLSELYFPFYCHLTCYFIGILVGYCLLKYLQKKDTGLNYKLEMKSSGMKKWVVSLIGLLALAIGLSSLFAAYFWTDNDRSYSKLLLGALYQGFLPLMFILSMVWVVYIAVIYPKNVINRFLSANFFVVIDRLSFGMYLVHNLVVVFFTLESRFPIRVAIHNVIFITGGVLLYSFVFALILFFLFEAPWFRVCKLLLYKEKPKTQPTNGNSAFNHGSNELNVPSVITG